jgi:putative membrane protein
VAGSVPIPWRRIEQVSPRHLAVAATAALVAFVLVGVPSRDVVSPSLLVVAPAAAVAICAMILPGVSGAFLLESMGLYDPTLRALRELDVTYIAVFAASAAVGLGAFAKLLGWLLGRWHAVTMAALVGLMVGALRALWPWLDADRGLQPPPLTPSTLRAVALVAVGFAAVTLLARRGARDDGRLQQ